MKLLLDTNLSPAVAQRLTAAGHDAAHVIDHGPSCTAVAPRAIRIGAVHGA